ncbi:hypothetical protein KAT92_01780 [Candidatus Babeliales bacterium]|nr:hypothetical protein [Candidatus Babeliales bacterium]
MKNLICKLFTLVLALVVPTTCLVAWGPEFSAPDIDISGAVEQVTEKAGELVPGVSTGFVEKAVRNAVVPIFNKAKPEIKAELIAEIRIQQRAINAEVKSEIRREINNIIPKIRTVIRREVLVEMGKIKAEIRSMMSELGEMAKAVVRQFEPRLEAIKEKALSL